MSGGVDSSVVAKLLTQADYDLSAVYMRNWDTRDESGSDSGCEWKKDYADVQRVCKALDIPCTMIDLSKEYWNTVFQPSLHEWEAGGTPNPDIWCNKEIKFGALMKHLSTEDTWVATGHYAHKSWSSPLSFSSNILPRPKLLRPVDRHKDQTYYLSAIPESSLSRTLFPLASFTKQQVREKAHEWNLPTAAREESMGICFVGEKRRFHEFISQYIPPKPGNIIASGKVVGVHQGLWQYTIGQNTRIRGMSQKMFVSHKDLLNNEIHVVAGGEHRALYRKGIVAKDWKWIWTDAAPAGIDAPEGFHALMQFRHRMLDVGCIVRRGKSEDTVVIEFEEPQKGVAPGQVAALWDGTWCLGCGVIESTI
ncbi:hypothetical protein PHLCEN_2v7766 [Hermanssonia centrifuga]|uniref:tRNA-5-taurinomethyluridine 2-sulfurtransferase n=1 Tax=Hermanssonia centrifuga TaxID=98765 RepID=A0A2R6NVG1_9APHY|nr:hypothetical protein PHLCEN_2v7766 [Hermanssonia centrifuga]